MRLLPLCLWFLNLLPLWFVVVFRDVRSILMHSNNVGSEWCGIIGCAAGVLFSVVVVRRCLSGKENGKCYVLKSAFEMKALTVETLLMYVFPMVAFDFCRWEGLLEFLVFFCCGCLAVYAPAHYYWQRGFSFVRFSLLQM